MAVIPHSLINMEYRAIDLTQLDDNYFKQYFPFVLDPFQKIACQSINYENNVLVCAHTSSGKTLVAEYAIHQAILKNRKIIYTSPIKALSNQKYHELSNKFDSVGLLTGDTTLNPTADILVMTTEILRNMLYKQNINTYYLIFDEIHYMTDRERGVVWEECIIFSTSPCIFLSATVENAEEFASWVSVTQNRVTNIVYNEKRIVPLIHYVFPVGGNGLYRIKGAKPSEYPTEYKQTESIHLSRDGDAFQNSNKETDTGEVVDQHGIWNNLEGPVKNGNSQKQNTLGDGFNSQKQNTLGDGFNSDKQNTPSDGFNSEEQNTPSDGFNSEEQSAPFQNDNSEIRHIYHDQNNLEGGYTTVDGYAAKGTKHKRSNKHSGASSYECSNERHSGGDQMLDSRGSTKRRNKSKANSKKKKLPSARNKMNTEPGKSPEKQSEAAENMSNTKFNVRDIDSKKENSPSKNIDIYEHRSATDQHRSKKNKNKSSRRRVKKSHENDSSMKNTAQAKPGFRTNTALQPSNTKVSQTPSKILPIEKNESRKLSHIEKIKDRSSKAFEKMDSKADTFNIMNFNDAISNIRRNRLDLKDISKIINLLETRNLLPLIVFSFRRKDCEKYATYLDRDYTTEEEKDKITMVFNNAVNTLDKNDRSLMPIKSLLPLLLRGIGIHHSGLLSILKEIQEILFSLNLLKVLFATETFSIGLNMPAKSIIFSTVFKFDGTETRPITSGEYIQMSGRAGRRGIDKEGICISILTESINIETALTLYNGKSNPIRSAFHLTYNMILNIISKEKDPIYLLKRSFFHFQKMRSIQNLREEVDLLYDKLQTVQRIISDTRPIIDDEKQNNINTLEASKTNGFHTGTEECEHISDNQLSKTGTPRSSTEIHNNPEHTTHDGYQYSNHSTMADVIECSTNISCQTLYFLPDLPTKQMFTGYQTRFHIDTHQMLDYLSKGRLLDCELIVNDFSIFIKNCVIGNVVHSSESDHKTDSYTLEVVIAFNSTLRRKVVPLSAIRAIYDVRVKVSNKLFGQLERRDFPLLFHKEDKKLRCSFCTICEQALTPDCLDETCYMNLYDRIVSDKKESPPALTQMTINHTWKETPVPVHGNGAGAQAFMDSKHNNFIDNRCQPGEIENGLENNQKMNESSIHSAQNNNFIDNRCDHVNTDTGSSNNIVSIREKYDTALRLKKYLESLHHKKNVNLSVRSRIDHIDQCQKMIMVLRRLGYISDGQITLKGRVASELSTSELILTELMFSGQLVKLSVIDIVSLLSTLVFEETADSNLSEESLNLYDILKSQIDEIQNVCASIDLSDKYACTTYSNELMDIVRLWAEGAPFDQLTARTTFFEGSIVRCLKRLEELLRQLSNAARAIGNTEMERIFSEGINKIKRGVVFCSSLYL